MRRDLDDLKDQLRQQEGLRLKPYRDPLGVLTIGYGRNLDAVGISKEEAEILFQNDVDAAYQDCKRTFPWFQDLDDVRQDVIINMVFNMGLNKVLGFKRMLTAMAIQDHKWAAAEMLNSRWAMQVGKRATDLAFQMTYGYHRSDRMGV